MKHFILSLLIFILSGIQVFAQDGAEKEKPGVQTEVKAFEQAVAKFNEALKTVESSSKQYLQSADVIHDGIMRITVEEIGKKGKSTLKTYEFNVTDIDKQALRATPKKDLILIPVATLRKQKLIKQTIGQKKVSYTNKIVIYARDISNGRELERLIKATIPHAFKIVEQRLSVASYDDYIGWLEENIGEVDLTKESYSQTFEELDDYPGSIKFEKSIAKSRIAKTDTYIFNLGTLNVSSVLFSNSGERFGISVSTKNDLKSIKHFEDGEQKSYVNTVTIVCESVEQARDVLNILKGVIPMASKRFSAKIEKVNSFEEGLEKLNSTVGSIQVNNSSVQQYFKGDCVMEFSTELAADGKIKQDVYSFNLIDLNKHSIEIKNKGVYLYLLVETQNKEKFIKYFSDGIQKSYTKSFKIIVPNIEEAMILKKVFSGLIGICIKNRKSFVAPSKGEMYKLLEESVGEIQDGKTTYNQNVEIADEGTVLKFKNTIVTEKSSKEKQYEVNLSELDAKSISMRTSDKTVFVTIKTNNSEKLIKYYEDGEVKSYQKVIEIRVDDIEKARLIADLLKHILD